MAVFNKLKSLKADYQLEMGKFGEAEHENWGLKKYPMRVPDIWFIYLG